MHRFLSENGSSFLWNKYPEIQLWGYLVFKETALLFPRMAIPFLFPPAIKLFTSRMSDPCFLNPHQHLVLPLFSHSDTCIVVVLIAFS